MATETTTWDYLSAAMVQPMRPLIGRLPNLTKYDLRRIRMSWLHRSSRSALVGSGGKVLKTSLTLEKEAKLQAALDAAKKEATTA